MNEKELKQEPIFTNFDQSEGNRFRWIAVTALLLAIGAILHFVVPSVAGISPNFMIAMYAIAINLTRPTLLQSGGIGLVAGLINIPTSKSAFPFANIPSELAGALCCAILVHLFTTAGTKRFAFLPGVSAGISTIASGAIFTLILKFVLALPWAVYLYGMLPVVIAVAAINLVITQLLYYPAEKLFHRQEESL
ncbi:MAG: ABC transporter [Sporomusaceae bacterium]|nr:ABC transporter [Sporomusaceae bacterium]